MKWPAGSLGSSPFSQWFSVRAVPLRQPPAQRSSPTTRPRIRALGLTMSGPMAVVMTSSAITATSLLRRRSTPDARLRPRPALLLPQTRRGSRPKCCARGRSAERPLGGRQICSSMAGGTVSCWMVCGLTATPPPPHSWASIYVRLGLSWPEQREWYYGDAVWSAVCLRSGVENYEVHALVADLFA